MTQNSVEPFFGNGRPISPSSQREEITFRYRETEFLRESPGADNGTLGESTWILQGGLWKWTEDNSQREIEFFLTVKVVAALQAKEGR